MKMAFLLVPALLTAARAGVGYGGNGPAASWDFGKVSGKVLRDSTGRGTAQISGPVVITGSRSKALHFGRDYHQVFCRFNPPLDYSTGLSVAAWVKPHSGEDRMCVFATWGFNLYLDGGKPELDYVNQRTKGWGSENIRSAERVPEGRWVHLVAVHDPGEGQKRLYVNGRLAAECKDPLLYCVDTEEMLVGQWYHRGWVRDPVPFPLRGLIGRLDAYERSLSGDEVRQLYEQGLAAADESLPADPPRRLRVEATSAAERRLLQVDVDYRDVPGVSDGAAAVVELKRPGIPEPVASSRCSTLPSCGVVKLPFSTEEIPPGTYLAEAVLRDRSGKEIVPIEKIPVHVGPVSQWLREHKEIKVLNNFAMELLSRKSLRGRSEITLRFYNPRKGWVFTSFGGEFNPGEAVQVSIDDGEPVIRRDSASTGASETMRELQAGEHVLRLRCQERPEIRNLVVRRVPELIYVSYPTRHSIPGYFKIDWDFLKKDVIPNVNTMVADDPGHGYSLDLRNAGNRFVQEWKRRGGKLYTNTQGPGQRPYNADLTVEEALRLWKTDPDFNAPTMSGSLGNEYDPAYFDLWPVWAEAIRRLKADSAMSSKAYLPYCGQMYSFRPGRGFLKAVVESGGLIAQKLYLRSPATEDEADRNIDRWYCKEQLRWEEQLPGATQSMVLVIGYFSGASEGLDTYADVSFKTFLDKELHAAANEPAMFGVGGVMLYDPTWGDEEIIRWGGRLLRHYCIEGRTDRFSQDPYKLMHVRNPDLADGLAHWTLEPAGADSITHGCLKDLFWIEGRFTREKQADTCLITRRDAARPNRFSQEIEGLTPGRLYSIKMCTGDYDDIEQGRSARKKIHFSVTTENAEELPQPRGDFIYTGTKWHQGRGFDRKNEGWFNNHLRVFRAKGTSARLVVSDWESQTEPGGPIGQKVLFSGIRIEPYYRE